MPVYDRIGVPEGHVEDASSARVHMRASQPCRLSAGNTSSSSCSSALSVSSPLLRVERKFWRREKELAKRLMVLSVIGLELNLISSDDSIVAFIIGYKVYRNATKKLKQ